MLKTIFIFIKAATISFSTSKGHKRGVLQLPEQTGPRRAAEWEGDYRDSVGGGRWAFVSLFIGDLVSDMSRKRPKIDSSRWCVANKQLSSGIRSINAGTGPRERTSRPSQESGPQDGAFSDHLLAGV